MQQNGRQAAGSSRRIGGGGRRPAPCRRGSDGAGARLAAQDLGVRRSSGRCSWRWCAAASAKRWRCVRGDRAALCRRQVDRARQSRGGARTKAARWRRARRRGSCWAPLAAGGGAAVGQPRLRRRISAWRCSMAPWSVGAAVLLTYGLDPRADRAALEAAAKRAGHPQPGRDGRAGRGAPQGARHRGRGAGPALA